MDMRRCDLGPVNRFGHMLLSNPCTFITEKHVIETPAGQELPKNHSRHAYQQTKR